MMHNLKNSHVPDVIRTRVAGINSIVPTTESKSQLPDAVCQKLYCATHHMICQPDLPTTADGDAMGHNIILPSMCIIIALEGNQF